MGTLIEYARLLREKKLSSAELTKKYLERIEKLDDKYGCYITVCADEALACAKRADEMLGNGEGDLLTGIPVGIKDNICTEGIRTTCASKMLSDFIPPYDATVIKKLKASGAVILGKLNMDEFAMGSSTESSYFKKTKNPYDPTAVPGGSSGGSAACVSADLAVYTLGSDTGGSIRQPAAFCSCVGLKPTYGRVSRYGLIAFASSLDQIGCLTKDVADSAAVMNIISGHDALDSTSSSIEVHDYTKALENGVAGMRIGIPREYIGAGISDEVRCAVEEAIKVYESLGAVCEICSLPHSEYALPAYYIISSAEASSNLARFDGIKYGYRTPNAANITQLYENTRSEGFGDEVKRRIMLGTYALSSGYYDAYYKKALGVKEIVRADFDRCFEDYDLLLTPTAPTSAYDFGEKADPVSMYMGDICTVAVNIAKLPAISIPAGLDKHGRPIGIQLIAKAFDEGRLLGGAYAYERVCGYDKLRPKTDEV